MFSGCECDFYESGCVSWFGFVSDAVVSQILLCIGEFTKETNGIHHKCGGFPINFGNGGA